jgi:hypothetical protein
MMNSFRRASQLRMMNSSHRASQNMNYELPRSAWEKIMNYEL